jgi:hypothetical protein
MLTTHDHSAALARISAAMDDCDEQRRAAFALPHTCDIEHAIRAGRLALIYARRAAWWRVLARSTWGENGSRRLYRTAVISGRPGRSPPGSARPRA